MYRRGTKKNCNAASFIKRSINPGSTVFNFDACRELYHSKRDRVRIPSNDPWISRVRLRLTLYRRTIASISINIEHTALDRGGINQPNMRMYVSI